jgi:hypothetical protein
VPQVSCRCRGDDERLAQGVKFHNGAEFSANHSREDLFRAPRHPCARALLASLLTPEPGRGVPDVGPGLSFPDTLAPPPG